jgi:hypothetical protein
LSSVLSNWPSKSQTLTPSYEARKTSDRLYNKLYHLHLLWVFLLCDFICVNIKIDWVRCWSSLPPIPTSEILWLIWKPPLQLSCRWGIGIILSTDKKILILLVSSPFRVRIIDKKLVRKFLTKKLVRKFFFVNILLSFQLKCSSNIDSIHYLWLANSFHQVPRNIHTLPSIIVNFLLNSLNAPITFVVCATNQS